MQIPGHMKQEEGDGRENKGALGLKVRKRKEGGRQNLSPAFLPLSFRRPRSPRSPEVMPKLAQSTREAWRRSTAMDLMGARNRIQILLRLSKD